MRTVSLRSAIFGAVLVGAAVLPVAAADYTQLSIPPLKFHSVVYDGARAWTLGGQNFPGTPLRSRWYVDVHTIDIFGQTTTEPMLPLPIGHADSALLGNTIVTAGGMTFVQGFESSDAILATDTTTAETEIVGRLPNGVHDPEVLKLSESEALVIGGWENERSSAQLVKVVMRSPLVLWSTSLAVSRSYATAHVLDGLVYIIGGLHHDEETYNVDLIETLDPETFARSDVGSLVYPRRYHSSRKVAKAVYVLGGTQNPHLGRGTAIGVIEKVDATGAQVVGRMIEPRYHFHTFAVDDRYIVSVGGQSDDGVPIYSIERFDTLTGLSEIIDDGTITADHDRVSFCDGTEGFVIGGEDPRNHYPVDRLMTIHLGGVCARD